MCFLKSMLVFGMLFLFLEKDLQAQENPLQRSHAISTPIAKPAMLPAIGTLDVVAIMVEFQPDTTRFTSGTGIFGPGGLPYLENAEDVRVEPLPHNQAYFESHLEFAKNYFEQSSDGQLSIDYRVLPQVYQLDNKMEAYSPTGETFTNEKVAMLARDAWQKVEEQGGFDATGLDPETTAFVIFHAGVGRDIELTGTNLTITPYDIPSLYFRKQDLGNLLGNSSFDGFSVNNGSFRITNSMILPRTQSRRGVDVTDTEFVFPLSINGLLCASIGSHLGLPDLFNTEDGNPAIGRFGLMDGAGFFNYNGLLPPEPSAWEKIYLGWQSPVEITADMEEAIELETASFNSQNNIVKYSLSASEYFLVENRHRNPDGTGVTLTFRNSDGVESTRTFDNMDEAFIYQESDFDTLFPAGVIVDADNFDFSLPGGIDYGPDEDEGTEDDRILNGGILIWHIDEAILDANLGTSGVNTDRFRRGVDLEEADGAQDIGPGIPGSLDNSAAFGSAFDFWWSQNNYRVENTNGGVTSFYENRFGPDTRPDNESNTGSPSYFEFYDFSDNLPTATFKIRPVQPEGAPELAVNTWFDSDLFYNPEDDYYQRYPLALSAIESELTHSIIIPSALGNLVYDLDAQTFSLLNNGKAQQAHAGYPLITGIRSEDDELLTIEAWELNDSGEWVAEGEHTIPSNNGLLSSENNELLEVDFSGYGIEIPSFELNPTYRLRAIQQSKILNGNYAQATSQQIQFFGNSESVPDYEVAQTTDRVYTGSFELPNGTTGFFILEDGKLISVNPDRSNPFTTVYESESIGWPAIADFDNDGSLDFIFADYTQNLLVAVNLNGGILDHFPYETDEATTLSGTPVVADLQNDGQPDLVVPTRDEVSYNLLVLDNNLQPASYSPLYVGGFTNPASSPLNPVIVNNHVFAVSQQGDVKGWHFEDMATPEWPYKYGAHPYNKVSALIGDAGSGPGNFSILNAEETYNWPNPADDHTNIRFQVADPGGKVEITIASLSGRIIFEQQVDAMGGTPEEIQVNTSSWGNGGYFAIVKATVNGETESKLIKIGVVH